MIDYDELRRSSAVAEERDASFQQTKHKPRLSLGEISPPQRFVLALMLFLNVTLLGCLCLLATSRIALPF